MWSAVRLALSVVLILVAVAVAVVVLDRSETEQPAQRTAPRAGTATEAATTPRTTPRRPTVPPLCRRLQNVVTGRVQDPNLDELSGLVASRTRDGWPNPPRTSSDCYASRFSGGKNGHPAAKPLSVVVDLVEKLCADSDTVLDPFMGSGTTLVAAKNLGRKAIGIEIEERYCEIAAQRCSQGVLAL